MDERSSTYSSQVIHVGPLWPGISGIKNLFIFGASYCDVRYDFNTSPLPTKREPLGVAFPGRTYAESGQPNWVGHLVTRLKGETPLLVYDFAHGGDTTDGVERQIKDQYIPAIADEPRTSFLRNILSRSQHRISWSASDTLFSIWVGINDCGYLGVEGVPAQIIKLFALIELLYEKGSRNFMLIDVPPMQRSPAMKIPKPGRHSFEEWNDLLRVHASRFAQNHYDATVIVYSSWETFSRVLDSPVHYGFNAGDEKKKGGSIWVDHIHPTSKMHDEVAKDAVALLKGALRFDVN